MNSVEVGSDVISQKVQMPMNDKNRSTKPTILRLKDSCHPIPLPGISSKAQAGIEKKRASSPPKISIEIRAQRQAWTSPIPVARPQIVKGITTKVASCTKCPISPIAGIPTCSRVKRAHQQNEHTCPNRLSAEVSYLLGTVCCFNARYLVHRINPPERPLR